MGKPENTQEMSHMGSHIRRSAITLYTSVAFILYALLPLHKQVESFFVVFIFAVALGNWARVQGCRCVQRTIVGYVGLPTGTSGSQRRPKLRCEFSGTRSPPPALPLFFS